MKRLLLVLGISLAILIVVFGIVYLNFNRVISSVLSSKLGVKVKVERIGFSNNVISIENVTIYNPKGSALPFALKIGQAKIEAPLSNYFRKQIVFNGFHLNDIEMNIEFYDAKNSKGNWSEILQNVNKDSGPDVDTGRSAVIKLLTISNMNFKLLLYGQKQPTVLPPIKSMKFKDISTDKGDLSRKISEAILNHIVQAVFWKNAIKSTIEFPYEVSKSAFSNMLDPIKSFFNFGGSSSTTQEAK